MSTFPTAPAPTLSQLALRAEVDVMDVLAAAHRAEVPVHHRRIEADKVDAVLRALQQRAA